MNNLPNILSVSRIILIFPVLYLINNEKESLACLIFAFAALTDTFDGYLARKYTITSPLGALLDLVADKLLVSSVLIFLVTMELSVDITIPSILIISREIIISSLRQFLAENQLKIIKASVVGKLKTITQFIAIGGLIFGIDSPLLSTIFYYLLWLSALMSIISLFLYVKESLINRSNLINLK